MAPATNEAGVIPGKNLDSTTKADIQSFSAVMPASAPEPVTTLTPPQPSVAISDFLIIQKEDYTWKVRARKFYGRLLMSLLFIQNFLVFGLIILALFYNKLAELQLIFSVVVPATLIETAFMVKVIIQWMFKDIEYPK